MGSCDHWILGAVTTKQYYKRQIFLKAWCGKARNEKLQLILAYYNPKDASVLGNINMKIRKLFKKTRHLIKAMNNSHVLDSNNHEPWANKKVQNFGKFDINLIKICVSTATQETNLMIGEKIFFLEKAVPTIMMFLLAFLYFSMTSEIVWTPNIPLPTL